MGNSFGAKKTIKVMKIDGETMKMRAPLKAGEVLKNHPGLVLLDSESVKHYGIRARALDEDRDLAPKRLYFLVEPPRRSAPPRRIRSGINMSAKDRLENLMLARRSTSDLSIMKKNGGGGDDDDVVAMAPMEEYENGNNKVKKLKLKLPKKEVEKLIRDSKDDAEAAQRIMGLYVAAADASSSATASTATTSGGGEIESGELIEKDGRRVGNKKLQKRVSFKPITTHNEGREIVVTS